MLLSIDLILNFNVPCFKLPYQNIASGTLMNDVILITRLVNPRFMAVDLKRRYNSNRRNAFEPHHKIMVPLVLHKVLFSKHECIVRL